MGNTLRKSDFTDDLTSLYNKVNSISSVSELSVSEFSQIINETKYTLGWSDDDMVEVFATSKQIVNRWEEGVAAPHPTVRTKIVLALAPLIAEHIVQ